MYSESDTYTLTSPKTTKYIANWINSSQKRYIRNANYNDTLTRSEIAVLITLQRWSDGGAAERIDTIISYARDGCHRLELLGNSPRKQTQHFAARYGEFTANSASSTSGLHRPDVNSRGVREKAA